MPRPLRIEYEHAFYHVMNRGKGRQFIFHNQEYYLAFLATLEEVHSRFDCVIHAYCLMGNHYHLLVETPKANLGRIMRHINGVYTQRYNKLKHTDGPLFRGRYKAILVEADAYLLQLSCYIHRNPIEIKHPLVTSLAQYPWSSYCAFINETEQPNWLSREMTYKLLGEHDCYKGYKRFVLQENSIEVLDFYHDHRGHILGSDTYKAFICERFLADATVKTVSQERRPDLTIDDVVNSVADCYQVNASSLYQSIRGQKEENEGRKVAMFLCQEILDSRLVILSDLFNLSHPGSVSYITSKIRLRMLNDKKFALRITRLRQQIIDQVT